MAWKFKQTWKIEQWQMIIKSGCKIYDWQVLRQVIQLPHSELTLLDCIGCIILRAAIEAIAAFKEYHIIFRNILMPKELNRYHPKI